VEADTIPGEAATGIAEMIRIRSAVTGRKEDDIARKILTAEEAFVNPHHQAPNRL
jgi:plasmid stability protein